MRRLLTLILLPAALIAGCAGSPPPRVPAADDACRLSGPDSRPAGAVMRAARSERLVAADEQTLINVDCLGNIGPGLAEQYSGAERRWMLTLRKLQGAAGAPLLTADQVAGIWRDAIAHGAGVDSVRVVDTRRLEVFLERPALSTLASHEFAVPVPAAMNSSPWTFVTALDPRNMLAGIDLMVVDETAVAEYAATLGMSVAPLPYDRTFVLLVPFADPADALDSVARTDLAASVRTASARPAATAVWWRDALDGCAALSSLPAWRIPRPVGDAGPGGPCVYYHADDAVGRDIAERVVALAAMDTTQSPAARAVVRCLGRADVAALRAVGVTATEMDRRLERGEGAALVASVRNPVPDSCGSARDLLRRAPWLAAGDRTMAGSVMPVADTRRYVVLASRGVSVMWDVYGNVRIMPPREVP